MKSKLFQSVLLIFTTVLLLSLLFLPATGFLAKADGGITKQSTIFTLASGGTNYTSAQNLAGVSVAEYGSVQVQVTSDVTSTQVVTVTPQFSNDPVVCTSATNWFNATEYQIFESNAATDTLVTDSEALLFTITGDGTAGREVSAQGKCFRVNLGISANSFTPTVYVRLLNRQ